MALEAKGSNPFTHPIQGYRQAVRHETLTFAFASSNLATPATPTNSFAVLLRQSSYLGVSPSGKATDSDSVIPKVRIFLPLPVYHMLYFKNSEHNIWFFFFIQLSEKMTDLLNLGGVLGIFWELYVVF